MGPGCPTQPPVPARSAAVDVRTQLAQRLQSTLLQRLGQQRVQPVGHAVVGARRLRHLLLDPSQRLELARDQPRAPALALAGAAVLSLIKRYLLGLREVLQAALVDKVLQRRQRGAAVGHPRRVEQHEPGRAESRLAPRGGCEFVAQPGNGRPHRARVATLPLPAQVTVPGQLQVHALHDGPHEGEVPGVQLAPEGTCGPRHASLGDQDRRPVLIWRSGRQMSGNLSAHVAFGRGRRLDSGNSA